MPTRLATPNAARSRRTRRPATVARFGAPLHRNLADPSYRSIVIEKFPVYLTEADAVRLADFTSECLLDVRAADTLRAALRGAVRVRSADALPLNIVTIGSTVRVHDRQSRRVETFQLVFPGDHTHAPNRLVVLTCAGLALLGARVGDLVTWQTSSGPRTAQIESIARPAASKAS